MEKVKEFIKTKCNQFIEWSIKNILFFTCIYVFKKHIKYLVSSEKYELFKPILKYKYCGLTAEYISDIHSLTDEQIEYYKNILNTLPLYEKLTIAKFLNFIFDIQDFEYEEENHDLHYDGFDVNRYVMYKSFFSKRKFYKIIKVGEDKFMFSLDNGKEVNLLIPFNFLLYTPISNANKRKLLIKKLK